jgi:hypothetical protein
MVKLASDSQTIRGLPLFATLRAMKHGEWFTLLSGTRGQPVRAQRAFVFYEPDLKEGSSDGKRRLGRLAWSTEGDAPDNRVYALEGSEPGSGTLRLKDIKDIFGVCVCVCVSVLLFLSFLVCSLPRS